MQWRPFMKKRFDCIRKNRIRGTRHDFDAFFGTKSAKRTKLWGCLRKKTRRNVLPAFMGGETFLFWMSIRSHIVNLLSFSYAPSALPQNIISPKNQYKELVPIHTVNIVSLVVKFMPSKHVSRVRFPNDVPLPPPPPYFVCASMA